MLKNNLSYLAITIVTVVCIWNILNVRIWNTSGVICWDAGVYYSYLPTAANANLDSLVVTEKKFVGLEAGINYIVMKDSATFNGNRVIKTSMGMAVLYSPFYLLSFLQRYMAYGNGGFGYDIEYLRTMGFFGITCLILGLFIMRRILKPYFTDGAVALTLLTIAFGTNVLYYTDYEGCMTHVPDMMLFALFVLLTCRWYAKSNALNSLLLGLLAGLLILIRPSNIILLIIFPFYSTAGLKDLQDRLKLLLSKWYLLAVIALMIVLVWVPQMWYWHYLTGKYLFYSYTGESFNFSNPQILNGLLSWQKGWLIYTPVGWLMLIGFIPMHRYAPKLILPFGLFMVCHLYVIFCWWSWWYGGSFSSRPMIETYAILAFPLTSLFQWVYNNSGRVVLKTAFSVLLLLLIALNLFQTYQYTRGFIACNDMTFKTYKSVFLKLHGPE